MPGSNPSQSTRSRKRALTLVPLAVASAAVTANVAVMGGPTSLLGQADGTPVDRVVASVPQAAIEAPASMSSPGSDSAVSPGQARTVAAASTLSSIPSAAMSAYQRAEIVINDADAACSMPWELVAAIGRVESDHGRVRGSSLDDSGLATPAIVGIALDGTRGTRAVPDSDGGELDSDTQWDRAVGPMQFIPSTWALVGVDGDNDGRRDPQDIDDAALAGAVYLCSGEDDLGTEDGLRAAVHRYNNSDSYVDLVLRVMESYQQGDWSEAQAGGLMRNPVVPLPSAAADAGPTKQKARAVKNAPAAAPAPTTPTPPAPTTPAPGPTPAPPAKNNNKPAATPTSSPSSKPSTPGSTPLPPNPLAPVLTPITPVTGPILEPVLSAVEALNVCSAEFAKIPDPLGLLAGAKKACADEITGKPLNQALSLIPNTLRGLLTWLGLVPPKATTAP